LAGQSAGYLESQLHAFKSGKRSNGMMNIVARGLSVEDIGVSAKLFSQRTLSVSSTNLPEPPTQVHTCIACHGEKGISPASEWPNLAGQNQAYLFKQLMAFKSGTRKNDVMREITRNLGEEEMQQFADYYSAFDVTIK
jgi:cytochrome c553